MKVFVGEGGNFVQLQLLAARRLNSLKKKGIVADADTQIDYTDHERETSWIRYIITKSTSRAQIYAKQYS